MRSFVLGLLLLASVAVAGGITLMPGTRYEFTDCASGGSASQTLLGGTYLTRMLTEDIWVCFAATCASGGDKFGAGTVLMLSIPVAGATVSCRSAASTGDLIFTAANQ